MLLSLKNLLDYKIDARDGSLGKVHDFFFDDQTWQIRYLVVDTGGWLSGRRVLISPESIGSPHVQGRFLPVTLSREQVENSPQANLEKPVSRQYEEMLYQYYNWTPYWFTGYGGILGPQPVAAPYPMKSKETIDKEQEQAAETHLRSFREVAGYHIQARDGQIGHAEDLIGDEESRQIRYFVVDTRNWLPGKQVLISPDWIEEINWAEQKVVVEVARERIKESPEYDPDAGINREYEIRLYDYYGRPKYWI